MKMLDESKIISLRNQVRKIREKGGKIIFPEKLRLEVAELSKKYGRKEISEKIGVSLSSVCIWENRQKEKGDNTKEAESQINVTRVVMNGSHFNPEAERCVARFKIGSKLEVEVFENNLVKELLIELLE